MKKILYLFSLLLISNLAFSQLWKNSVRFESTTQKINATEYTITITATITKGWHIFSKTHDSKKADGIGLPVEMTVSGKDIQAMGAFRETPKAKKHTDEFGLSMILENKAFFTQKVTTKSQVANGIVTLEGQVCSDTEGCYPFKTEFPIQLK